MKCVFKQVNINQLTKSSFRLYFLCFLDSCSEETTAGIYSFLAASKFWMQSLWTAGNLMTIIWWCTKGIRLLIYEDHYKTEE